MKQKISILLLLILWSTSGLLAQMDQYNYQRAINGINDQWHRIALPTTIYEKVHPNFSDIRIYGITAQKDTIEAPYLLKIAKSTLEKEQQDFKLINTSKNQEGHYFTFELEEDVAINQIALDFLQDNFDWTIKLEGSQNQQKWFTIKEDYRLVAIKNQLTNYLFSTITFPSAKYRYYRLVVQTKAAVTLKKATLNLQETTIPNYQNYTPTTQNITFDKARKVTTIDIDLPRLLPVSFLKIDVVDDFDYYRPMTIQYLTDSIKTDNGWRYQYQNLQRTVLSSLEKKEFTFKSTLAKKIRINIQNQDNPPLTIEDIGIKGYQHQLIARFTKPADYFLTYGREKAALPRYDLVQFTSKIPENLAIVSLAAEQNISKATAIKKVPIFENSLWLWGLMIGIILILGWFTLKMLKESN